MNKEFNLNKFNLLNEYNKDKIINFINDNKFTLKNYILLNIEIIIIKINHLIMIKWIKIKLY